jgi:predicted transcriptional regulator
METCETRLKVLTAKQSYRTQIWKRELELNSWLAETTTSKRRDKLAIIAEILEIAKEGTLKTQIMYKANLSFAQLNEYLKFMLKIKLMQKLVNQGKDIYIATEKGLDFLQRQCELTELLKTEEEKPKNGVRVPPANLLRKN